MKINRVQRFVCAFALLGGLAGVGKAFDIGERVGPVEVLAVDGRSLMMTNYSERRGTVVLFLSARAEANDELQAIRQLSSQVRLRGILFVGLFPNAEETADEVKVFTQRHALLFPVYRDPEGKATRQFTAKATPEAYVLDSTGALVYHGGIGSTKDGHLAQALSAFSAGRPVQTNQVPPTGIPIGQPGPKREPDDPFGSLAFSSELIFEKIPDVPAHHCSTITEAGNGDLLVVWYGGSYESADDQTLFLSRKRAGERVWSRPEALISDSTQPPGNPVVFRAGTRLFIVWARMMASRPLRRGGGWGQTRLWYRTSDDEGVTWSKDELFLGGVREGMRNVPILLASGELILPLGRSFAGSKDHGLTWEQLGAVASGGQPTVIERSDGSLLTLLRKEPRLMQSESRDGGRSWSRPAPTELKNPDAGIAMTRLRSGTVVLVFNNSATARTPLSIARSRDEGRSWEPPLTLESNPGEYSYPCVIQASDGLLHITYTFRRYAIKHVAVNESWLTHLERPN